MKKHILVGVTGSIAAYKAADIVRRLQEKDFDVKVVMTNNAKKFVTTLTFETLTKQKVVSDMFESNIDWDMEHISLAKWADLYLIAPATANIISKVAFGIADDVVCATAITMKKPVVIAPAMNTAMWTNAIVCENIKRLKNFGINIIEPKCGQLACGDVGQGALADVSKIVDDVVLLLK